MKMEQIVAAHSVTKPVGAARAKALTVKALGALLATAALAGATSVAAAPSNPAEMRGYSRCVAAFDRSNLSGVTLPRVYYIAETRAAKTYYVNASAWRNGERVAQRITCETSPSGREVYSVQAADGRYALNAGNQVIVAER